MAKIISVNGKIPTVGGKAIKAVGGADITEIKDALTLKTNISGTLDEAQTILDITALASRPTEEIPNYVRAEAKRLAEVVKSHQSANSISFVCVSDHHNDNTTQGNISTKHCGMGAWLLRQLVPIDFGVYLGDYVRGGSIDTEATTKAQYLNAMRSTSMFSELNTQGNHDNGQGWWDGYLDYQQTFNRIGRFAINVVRPSTEADRGYYYADIPNKNFRVIVLNTNDMKGVAIKNHSVSGGYCDGHRVSVQQLQWLIDVLSSMPSGYRFIVVSHEPIHWANSVYTDANGVTWNMAQNWNIILDAYVGGTTYSITQDSQTISGTFENTNNGILIATFHGHTHNFIDGKYGTQNIPRISTPNASYGRTNEYGHTSYPQAFREQFGELDEQGNQVTTYFKTTGSANETAFVVNTIDLDNMICYSDHYGAGRDRTISLADTIIHSVASTIGAHITASTIPSTVEDGESLSITLTPDANYTNIVSVTMGGVDITAIAYANNTINIASVTGDVVITASAYFSGNYVPVVGYTDNARWSASDGTIRTGATGNVAVNGISFDRASGSEKRFELSGVDWTHDSNCIIVGFVDGVFKAAMYLNSLSASTMANYGIIVEGSGNNCRLTFKDPEQSAYVGINSFKISGYGLGSNAIISEVIE